MSVIKNKSKSLKSHIYKNIVDCDITYIKKHTIKQCIINTQE